MDSRSTLKNGKTIFGFSIQNLLASPIGRDALGSLSLKVVNVGLTFLATVLLARLLGPAEYGVYSFIFATITILSIPSEFGLPTLVVRETARGLISSDFGSIQGIWRWTSKMTIFLSIGLVAVSILALLLFRQTLASPRVSTFLCALGLIPLIALGDLRGAALSGLRHILAGQLPEFLIRPAIFLLLLAGAAIWIKTGLSAAAAMLLYLFAAAIAFAVGAWLLWKKTPFLIRRASPVYDKSVWLASALPLALIGGMTLITQQASLLLLGFFVPDSSIGLFRIAAQVAQLASFGLLAINTVLTPRFAALHAQGDKPRLQQLVTGSARLILLINLLLTLAFFLGGKLFLHLAFGINYEGAYNPLIILLVGQLINSGTGSVGVLLNMSGHEQHVARVTVIAALLNVALNLALIPFLGINGSAVATSASLIIWNILLWWAVRKKLGLNSLAFG